MFASFSNAVLTPAQLPDRLYPKAAEPLVNEVCDGERRIVALTQESAPVVQVYEHSSGPLTRTVYESRWHAHRVTIEHSALKSFFSCASSREALSNVSLFFLISNRGLSDFLDFLDDNFIPYIYESELEDQPVAHRDQAP